MSTPIETLVKNFDEFTAELSATLDQQKAELKEYGETTEKTGARIDELGNTLLEIGEELKAAQTRMDELEKAAQRPGYGEEREARSEERRVGKEGGGRRGGARCRVTHGAKSDARRQMGQ